mmetsp:Transcript_84144/g.265612  ORF Transcript_84144/g.265612 Transcript_84144/m.265612 type:complete len:252 (-) Transcript_84144:751-1506(-)
MMPEDFTLPKNAWMKNTGEQQQTNGRGYHLPGSQAPPRATPPLHCPRCLRSELRRRLACEVLGDKVLLDAGLAPLAGVAALLVASEGRVRGAGGAVDHDGARAELARHGQRALGALGPDGVVEAVDRVIRDGDTLLFRLVGDDGEHGAEDLLLRNGHLVVHVREDRGLDVVAVLQARWLAGAARDEAGTLLDALLQVALHAVPLRLRDKWADGRLGVGGPAHGGALGDLLGDGHGLLVPGLGHEHAAEGVA